MRSWGSYPADVEHLAKRFAANHLVDMRPAGIIHQEMRFVGGTQQIVVHSERFLVGADQENRQVIGIRIDAVQFQRLLDIPQIDKLVDLPVGIAGDVAQSRPFGGFFRQPGDRNNRKELIQGPAVRRRLKNGEIADVLAGQIYFRDR